MLMDTLSLCDNGGIDICSDDKLTDLEYGEDVMLLSGDSVELQVFLHRLDESIDTLGIRFAPSKC